MAQNFGWAASRGSRTGGWRSQRPGPFDVCSSQAASTITPHSRSPSSIPARCQRHACRMGATARAPYASIANTRRSSSAKGRSGPRS